MVSIEDESFSDPYHRAFFEWLLLRTGRGFMVACREGVVVGYAVCGISRGKGHLVSIATSPTARHSGVGTSLMKSIIDYLIGEKVGEVSLEVRPSNGAAIAFYRRFSFVESGRRKAYYGDGEDAVVMRMRLEG